MYAKFSLSKEIKEALLSANDRIVEQTTDDYFGGAAEKTSAEKNELGKILMEICKILKNKTMLI